MKSAQSTPQGNGVRSVVLGTAGHIDHGKTALVYALTGTDTDRLPEEKRRGITVDLGFASLALTDAQGRVLEVSLIDVPGHHAFVRNMLAGAGGIDCVMLVIAANEGVMAQTEEHLAICSLLGIRRGVIALTKRDAVNAERLQQVREEVTRFVAHTFLEGAAVVSVSAFTGEGIQELKAELVRLVSAVPERSVDRVTRLPLDRVFSMRGFGTVVTGTLQSGTVRVEDSLELQPAGRDVRVRGVQVHGGARREAQAPNRVALNLAGVDVAEVSRGDTLVPPETLEPVTTLDVEITLLPGAPRVRHRSKVRVHAFTSEVLATVLLYDEPEGVDGGAVLARLKLAKPLLLAPGDRFVLRQPSPALTVGGGRVLDAYPVPSQRKATAERWLREVRHADVSGQMRLRVQRQGVRGTQVAALVRETGMTEGAVRDCLAPSLASGEVVDGGSGSGSRRLLWRDALNEAGQVIVKELSRSKAEPMQRAALLSRTRLADWVFELAAQRLARDGRIEAGARGLALPGQAVGGMQAERLAAIEELYRVAGLASPILSEVSAKLGIAAKEVSPLITILLRGGRLVRLGADHLLVHAGALAQLKTDLQKHRGESFDVSRFKSFTGLTRKHAIPVLEYLDGARVTRNSGGLRVVL